MIQKLKDIVTKLTNFVKSIISERDGSGSASRTMLILVAVGGVLALLLATWIKKELPSGEQLGGLAKVIAGGSASYAMNQVKGSADVIRGKDENQS